MIIDTGAEHVVVYPQSGAGNIRLGFSNSGRAPRSRRCAFRSELNSLAFGPDSGDLRSRVCRSIGGRSFRKKRDIHRDIRWGDECEDSLGTVSGTCTNRLHRGINDPNGASLPTGNDRRPGNRRNLTPTVSIVDQVRESGIHGHLRHRRVCRQPEGHLLRAHRVRRASTRAEEGDSRTL